MSSIRGLLLAAALVVAAVGCGNKVEGPPKLPTVPASGKVTYRGKAVANADVAFHAIDGKAAPRGRTDANGAFVLSTYGEKDGAPVGSYKVTVAIAAAQPTGGGDEVLAPLPAEGEGAATKSTIPVSYAHPDTTTLKAEVTQAGPNEFKLELK